MKKYIVLAAFVLAGVISISQTQDVMTVKLKDGTIHEFKIEEVGDVTFQTEDDPITPEIYLNCPSGYDHPHLIDLGLPSGTLWLCCNVGASVPEEYGGYYAWGETEEKNYYNWSTYAHCDGSSTSCHNIGDDIAGTEYDVAHVKWGGSYSMPTIDQIKELMHYCTRTWITRNGVKGTRVTGRNGGTIFLPAAGRRYDLGLFDKDSLGHYWSSSLYMDYDNHASNLSINSHRWFWGSFSLRYGLSVRAVFNHEKIHHVANAIDLGLPSGTKWASWNVGASAPEEAGGYYAWGETEEKEYYNWNTYTHCNGSAISCYYIGDDIAGTENDVAHVKWGGSWSMPTKAQQKELIENCTREWTQLNGVNGILVTGPNGNSIFLPATGSRWNYDLSFEGSFGYYWSSSLSPNNVHSASRIFIQRQNWYWDDCHERAVGLSVRAVCP